MHESGSDDFVFMKRVKQGNAYFESINLDAQLRILSTQVVTVLW
jgi:hypothetical protein